MVGREKDETNKQTNKQSKTKQKQQQQQQRKNIPFLGSTDAKGGSLNFLLSRPSSAVPAFRFRDDNSLSVVSVDKIKKSEQNRLTNAFLCRKKM